MTLGPGQLGPAGAARSLRLSDQRPVHLLKVDPSLGDALDPRRFEVARGELVATGATLLASGEDAGPVPEPDTTLLVIGGLLLRQLVIHGRPRSELLGPGDVIRPWDRETIGGLPAEPDMLWRIVKPTHVAALGDRLLEKAGAWPEIIHELISRAVKRAHSLAVLLAVSSLPRIEDRLSVVFWHLADRWGRVTPEGVRLELPLTHELLAELVGAQRPTVTTALSHLSDTRSIGRDSDGSWLLGAYVGREPGASVRVAPFAS